ncbi:MAG TPA: YlxR family protein [Streptosporangiaceae bacterium]
MAVGTEQQAPTRTCVGCKERAVKSSLLRLVAVGDDVLPDPQARLPGRGAYLHPSPACFELACRRRVFPRALRAARPLGLASLAGYIAGPVVNTGEAETARQGSITK